MGCGNSDTNPQDDMEVKTNQKVEQDIKKDLEKAKKVHKLLLLGPGNSGKSTFFKQLNCTFGSGITEYDKKHARQTIYDSIIDQMKNILTSCKEERNYTLEEDIEKSAQYITNLPRDIPIKKDIAFHIKKLWDDKTIKKTFDERSDLGIVDSCPHFFNSIERIAKENYMPTMQDILLARTSTTGIREDRFEYKLNWFEIYDVGGQRNERSKWIHCFDQVHAVMFVTSLSCYDQVLYEDGDVNAMDEALELWDEVVNSHYFANRRTSMIIFFNKSDLFEDKIKRVSLQVWNSDYDGELGDITKAIDFIRETFLQENQDHQRQIYTHVTCATNQDTVKRVFHDVQHGVVLKALTKNGIL